MIFGILRLGNSIWNIQFLFDQPHLASKTYFVSFITTINMAAIRQKTCWIFQIYNDCDHENMKILLYLNKMFYIKFFYVMIPKVIAVWQNIIQLFSELHQFESDDPVCSAMAVVVSSCNCVSYPTKAVKARIETH